MAEEPLLVVAEAVSGAADLESLVRPLLRLVREVTGLESAYLTEIDEQAATQRILFSVNEGELVIPEALTVEWSDSVCRRSLEQSKPVSSEVPLDFPESRAAGELGLQSYVGVPVVGAGGEVLGTLCAASRGRRSVGPAQLRLLRLCAEIIAAEVFRERTLVLERERANIRQGYADTLKSLEKHKVEMLQLTGHELRGPLAVARGHLDMVAGGDYGELPEPVKAPLATAKEQLDHMDRLVAEMLQASRLRDTQLVLDPQPSDLAELCWEAVSIVSPRSRGRHQIRVDAEGPIAVVVDRARILLVLTVLLDNAIKYSPEGGEVVLWAACADGACLVSVEDHGIGIPAERVAELFQPFKRLGDPAAGGIGGTGLGLYLARELVRLHGGDIEVEAVGERGTRFAVRLPSPLAPAHLPGA